MFCRRYSSILLGFGHGFGFACLSDMPQVTQCMSLRGVYDVIHHVIVMFTKRGWYWNLSSGSL